MTRFGKTVTLAFLAPLPPPALPDGSSGKFSDSTEPCR